MKRICSIFILAGTLLLPGGAALAQQQQQPTTAAAGTDQDIRLLREDVRSQKKQIIAANLQLTDAEAVKFWPVYDAYSAAAAKIGDTRVALIKEYAQTYDNMTDVEAKSLIKKWAAADQAMTNLRIQYIPNVERVLPGKKAALFFQLDRRVNLVIDLQLASMIPMLNP